MALGSCFFQLNLDLLLLDRVHRGASLRAASYIRNGRDPTVLADLAAAEGGGEALGLRCMPMRWAPIPRLARRLIFAGGAPAPEVCLRLAQVWEAASRGSPRHLASAWLPEAPPWLEIFVLEAVAYRARELIAGRRAQEPAKFRAEVVEGMLEAAGEPPALLVRLVTCADPREWDGRDCRRLFTRLKDFAAALERHPQAVLEGLDLAAHVKVGNLELLAETGVPEPVSPQEPPPSAEPLGPAPPRDESVATRNRLIAERLAQLAADGAKSVRAAAQPLVLRDPDRYRPVVECLLTQGAAVQRSRAAHLLLAIAGDAARPLLEERLAADLAVSVKKTLRELLARPGELEDDGGRTADEPATASPAPPAVELPELEPPPLVAPVAAETRAALWDFLQAWNSSASDLYQQRTGAGRLFMSRPVLYTKTDLTKAVKALERARYKPKGNIHLLKRDFRFQSMPPFRDFLTRPEVEAIHAVRLLTMLGYVDPYRGFGQRILHLERLLIGPGFDLNFEHWRESHRLAGGRPFGLRELAAVFRTLGLDQEEIGWTRLRGKYWGQFRWQDEAIWPYFVESPELLEEALGTRASSRKIQSWERADLRTNAFEVLATLPALPPSLVPGLWDVALGEAKTLQPLAQSALEAIPGKEATLIEALAASRWTRRAAAAEWLGRLRYQPAREALLARWGKEKQEHTRGAVLQALEDLGEDVDRLLPRDGLLREAETNLAKGRGKALQWFPFELLPELAWHDGRPVAPPALEWLIVRAAKLGRPEPGPLLRRYVARLGTGDREVLGRFVLDAWIARDTRPMTRAEVEGVCRQRAAQIARWDRQRGEEEIFRDLLRFELGRPSGSAIAQKGILAVTAACGGSRLAPAVERYLKTWYGQRAAQCKALLHMLSWIDDPSALQLLLAVAARFRTAGIQREAERLGEQLAERRGWSLAELGDRTVPDAGFSWPAGGGPPAQSLDLGGGRVYTTVLDDDLEIVLENPGGRVVKALPGPRAGDDPEVVKAARKALAASRRQLKEAVRLQTQRLYEALCTERSWPFDDWRVYLAGHPILGRLCRRLVWTAAEGDQPGVTFRLLDDGELTAAGDEPVELAADAVVRLAHDLRVGPGEAAAWLEHFEDYEVAPLFRQLGTNVFTLDDEHRNLTELPAFEGYMIEAFTLRGAAGKLGWNRGEAQDGGWFGDYRKRFPTLGLDAVLLFTGNGLPEENVVVALRGLAFEAVSDEKETWRGAQPLRLRDVPRVLLSEAWNDLRLIGEQGSGYDPDWQKKCWW